MDFTELVRNIYEMDRVFMSYSHQECDKPSGIAKTIGRVEEYDNIIEILFEEDVAPFVLDKSLISGYTCEEKKVTVFYEDENKIVFKEL